MSTNRTDIDGMAKLFRVVRVFFLHFAKKYDLSVPELGIVFDVFYQGQITITELTRQSRIPKSTVSRSVDKLVQRGYLNRVRPEDNRRIVQISITDDFYRELEQLKEDRDFQKILKDFVPDSKVQEAAELYFKLLDIMSEGTE